MIISSLLAAEGLTNMILTSAFIEGCALFAIAACAFLIK